MFVAGDGDVGGSGEGVLGLVLFSEGTTASVGPVLDVGLVSGAADSCVVGESVVVAGVPVGKVVPLPGVEVVMVVTVMLVAVSEGDQTKVHMPHRCRHTCMLH